MDRRLPFRSRCRAGTGTGLPEFLQPGQKREAPHSSDHTDMNRVVACIALLPVILVSGCGRTEHADGGGPEPDVPGMVLDFGDAEVTLTPSYAGFATLRRKLTLTESANQNGSERVDAVVHRIYLANYDLELTDPANQDYRRIGEEGQLRVEIQIEADQSAPIDVPVEVREYSAKPEPFNRVSWIAICRRKGDADVGTILGGGKASGVVRITSSDRDRIAGEIDFRDSDGGIRGSFTAKRL